MLIPLVQRHCINGITKKEAIDIKKIPEIDERVTVLESDEWILVPDDEFGSIFDDYKASTDLIIKLQYGLTNPSMSGTEIIYLPKGVMFPSLPTISDAIRTSSTSMVFVKMWCPLNVLTQRNYKTIERSIITLDLTNSAITTVTEQLNFGKQDDSGSSGNWVNIFRRKTVND